MDIITSFFLFLSSRLRAASGVWLFWLLFLLFYPAASGQLLAFGYFGFFFPLFIQPPPGGFWHLVILASFFFILSSRLRAAPSVWIF
ncbi:MAG: hypothetical protein ACI4D7_02830 [Lachnospiraceae bacterium]